MTCNVSTTHSCDCGVVMDGLMYKWTACSHGYTKHPLRLLKAVRVNILNFEYTLKLDSHRKISLSENSHGIQTVNSAGDKKIDAKILLVVSHLETDLFCVS